MVGVCGASPVAGLVGLVESVQQLDDLACIFVADRRRERASERLRAYERAQLLQLAHVDPDLRSLDPGADRQPAAVQPDRVLELLALGGEDPQLADRAGHAGLVSESLLDVEAEAELRFSFDEVAAALSEQAEVLEDARDVHLVSESLVDVEAAAVLRFGFG